MKTWTRQPDGSYKVCGAVETRKVRLEIIRPGYPCGGSIHLRGRIEGIIEDAIRTGHARAQAYRLHPIESQTDPDQAQRLRALHERQRNGRWREPAQTRSEAARRAWATRRARSK